MSCTLYFEQYIYQLIEHIMLELIYVPIMCIAIYILVLAIVQALTCQVLYSLENLYTFHENYFLHSYGSLS